MKITEEILNELERLSYIISEEIPQNGDVEKLSEIKHAILENQKKIIKIKQWADEEIKGRKDNNSSVIPKNESKTRIRSAKVILKILEN